MRVLATRPGIRAAEAGAGRAKPTQTGWESGRGLLLGRNPSWRRAYQALLTSISHDQDLRRKMFRNRLELRGLAAPDGVALSRERDQEMLWGRRRGDGTIVAVANRWSALMPQPNDLSRSLVALDQDSTIIAVVEMSQSSWLVAGMLPGIRRENPGFAPFSGNGSLSPTELRHPAPMCSLKQQDFCLQPRCE